MTVPVHKACYRCGAPTRDLVDPEDPMGGRYGCCDHCRQRAAAAQAAIEWKAAETAKDAKEREESEVSE
jgi:hypothetical protein